MTFYLSGLPNIWSLAKIELVARPQVFTVQTPGEAIVKRLTAERMTEIRDQLAREGEEIKKLEAEVELLSGKDDVSDEMLDQIQAE